MHTQEIISYVQKKASGFTQPELLVILDQIQKVVYSHPSVQNQVIDATTGMPPFLATTNNVYQYDCPADCLKTTSIFTRSTDGYRDQNYDYYHRHYRFNGSIYLERPVRQIDATYGRRASVTFIDNPGTTTEQYYHLYIKKPLDLDSTNIQMEIPERFHLDMVDGLLARVQDEQYGDNTRWQYWRDRRMPVIIQSLNLGAQPRRNETPIRWEMQNRTGTYGRYWQR